MGGLRHGISTKIAPGISSAEAAGLPVDDNFTYLSSMKRYIINGGQLGTQNAYAGGMGAASFAGGAMAGATSRQSVRPDDAGLPRLSSTGTASRASSRAGGGW